MPKTRFNRKEALEEFRKWRERVDECHWCNTFDLALGWFAGKGHKHDRCCDLAALLQKEEKKR